MRSARVSSAPAREGLLVARSLPPLAAFLLLLSPVVAPPTGLACRYNVRDVGFVDLESEAYRLYVFLQSEGTEGLELRVQRLAASTLRDCNVLPEILLARTARHHPAWKHLPAGAQPSSASVVLVSPDGRALPLARPSSGGGSAKGEGPEPRPTRLGEFPGRADDGILPSLAALLGEVASSPKREELLTAASGHFAAVLFIEGQGADPNRRAVAAITGAFEAIRGQMAAMPKAIAEPPILVTLRAASLVQERILLWSLGLDPIPAPEPRAAIIYGRARWMGPLMKGEEISEPNVTGLLSIVGADCECGLDVGWTLGTRLPVRWGESRHAHAAKALGFDPESPLVKVEVERIASRSRLPRPTFPSEPRVVLSSDPRPMPGAPDAGRIRASDPGVGLPAEGSPPSKAFAGAAPVLLRAWQFVGGLGLVVLATGAVLLWRSSRRRSRSTSRSNLPGD